MTLRYCNDKIDIAIDGKAADCIKKVEEAHEIKLGRISLEHCLQFGTLTLIFFGKFNIMFTIDIYDMKHWFEKIQYPANAIKWCAPGNIFEITQEHYIFNFLKSCSRRHDD